MEFYIVYLDVEAFSGILTAEQAVECYTKLKSIHPDVEITCKKFTTEEEAKKAIEDFYL